MNVGDQNGRQIGEKLEPQFLVIEEKLHNLQIQVFWSFECQQAIRLFELRELIAKLCDQALFDCLVG